MLRPLESLSAAEAPLSDVLTSMRAMLRTDRLELSLAVEGSSVVDGASDYWALRWLGCSVAPVDSSRRRVDVPLEALGLYDDTTAPERRVYPDVMDLLSRDRPTPMVRLRGSWGRARLWAKLEWYNPLSLSIKDRTAASILAEALRRRPDAKVIYEVSSANTGVALASLAAVMGLRARLYMPVTAESFGPLMARLLGAEVVQRGSSTVEVLPEAKEEAARDGALMPNQFESPANFLTHVGHTAKEVEAQANFAGLKLKGIFVTMGTGGHSAGISFYFKNRRPDVKVFGVQPARGSVIPGIRRQDMSSWWPIEERPDVILDVTELDAAAAAVRVARSNGILPGMSGGAAIAAFESVADELEEGDYVVILPDHGIKYLERYYRLLGKALGLG